jgi:pimeloyl-ACP methyl ester carboxylesterase
MNRAKTWAVIVLLLVVAGWQLTDQVRRPGPPHHAEYLQAGDVRVRALRAGHGDTTIVLIHGFGEHLLTWRSVVDPLAADYRVIALDLPGFGGSDKPEGPYTLTAMSDRVSDFLVRYARPPTVVVGHSMGGAIAADVAIRYPALVQALVLIAPAGLRVGLGPITGGMTPGRASAIGVWEMARAFITPLHDPEWMTEPAGRSDYDPSSDPAFQMATAKTLQDFDFTGIGERFRDVTQPTLIIWGRQDPVIPYEVAQPLAEMIRCHRLVTLERTLHRPQAERPDTVVTILRRFLERPGCPETP